MVLVTKRVCLPLDYEIAKRELMFSFSNMLLKELLSVVLLELLVDAMRSCRRWLFVVAWLWQGGELEEVRDENVEDPVKVVELVHVDSV